MTENWASPPVDLSQAVVLLPEATPITEAPQEPNPHRAPKPAKSTSHKYKYILFICKINF